MSEPPQRRRRLSDTASPSTTTSSPDSQPFDPVVRITWGLLRRFTPFCSRARGEVQGSIDPDRNHRSDVGSPVPPDGRQPEEFGGLDDVLRRFPGRWRGVGAAETRIVARSWAMLPSMFPLNRSAHLGIYGQEPRRRPKADGDSEARPSSSRSERDLAGICICAVTGFSERSARRTTNTPGRLGFNCKSLAIKSGVGDAVTSG